MALHYLKALWFKEYTLSVSDAVGCGRHGHNGCKVNWSITHFVVLQIQQQIEMNACDHDWQAKGNVESVPDDLGSTMAKGWTQGAKKQKAEENLVL